MFSYLQLALKVIISFFQREFDPKFNDLGNCLWLVAVTFLTIGYGDLTPVTVLGRSICIFTGFMGIIVKGRAAGPHLHIQRQAENSQQNSSGDCYSKGLANIQI